MNKLSKEQIAVYTWFNNQRDSDVEDNVIDTLLKDKSICTGQIYQTILLSHNKILVHCDAGNLTFIATQYGFIDIT
jgi:hypothetical protein